MFTSSTVENTRLGISTSWKSTLDINFPIKTSFEYLKSQLSMLLTICCATLRENILFAPDANLIESKFPIVPP